MALTLNWLKLGDMLRLLSSENLHKLAAHVNSEIFARNREGEHAAHLRYTPHSSECAICREREHCRKELC